MTLVGSPSVQPNMQSDSMGTSPDFYAARDERREDRPLLRQLLWRALMKLEKLRVGGPASAGQLLG